MWGEAQGSGAGGPAQPFKPGNDVAAGRAPPDETRLAARAKQAETVKDRLYTIATTGLHEMTQIAAGREFLNRVEGLPVARTIQLNTDDASELDDAALERRAAELEASLRGDAGGDAPSPLPR